MINPTCLALSFWKKKYIIIIVSKLFRDSVADPGKGGGHTKKKKKKKIPDKVELS